MLLISRNITGVVNFINLRNSRPQQTTMMLSVTVLFTVFSIGTGYEPGKLVFDSSVVNISVISNTTAVLPCSVGNGRNHQVAWMNPDRILISSGVLRVIDDTRMSIERPYMEDWNLHIRKIRFSDVGSYTCSVDTYPVLVKIFYLDVQVPPTINDWSTEDMVAREGDQVQLICNATGHPMPVITWIKRLSNGHEENISNPGEVLLIHNVSRYCDGIYECRADNGILPNAVRQIQVEVEFPPEVKLLNRRQGQMRGRITILVCEVTASPHSYNIWKKDGVQIPSNNWKYRIRVYDENDKHLITLGLRIVNVAHDDFGEYTCQASNKLGSDSETMILYEILAPTTRRVTTTIEMSQNNDETKPSPMIPFISQDTVTPTYRPMYDSNTLGKQGYGQVHRRRGNGAAENYQTSGLFILLILHIGGVICAFQC